jgi:pilus assembly protein CpaF
MTAGVELPHRAIREQIASAFDLLVQIQRLVDGSRRITHISEVLGMEADVVTLQDIFVASPPNEDEAYAGAHRLLSPLRATGLTPHFFEKLAANNVVLPPSFFSGDDPDQLRASIAAVGFGGGYE